MFGPSFGPVLGGVITDYWYAGIFFLIFFWDYFVVHDDVCDQGSPIHEKTRMNLVTWSFLIARALGA